MNTAYWRKSLLLAAVLAAVLAVGLAGCGQMKSESKKPEEPPAPAPVIKGSTDRQPHDVVLVYFSTDRNWTNRTEPDSMFGNGRARTMSYGSCTVSIPRNHKAGELESPSFWRLEFRENPDRHVVLLSTLIKDKAEYFKELSDRVRNSKEKKSFLFVHGYNVTFKDAARRTAQIAYDLDFDGAPVFYSWPSQGEMGKYTVDEQNAEWAQANIKAFLSDYITRSRADNIYLIAHSMGNRLLTRALSELFQADPGLRDKIKEIILAAPDIDAEVFRRDIAPRLAEGPRKVTLYASSRDVALAASRKIHGSPRAGDSGSGLVVVNGVETVDATNQDTSFLGHSYIVEERSLLVDLSELMKGLRPDNRFGLRAVDAQGGRYWEFKR